MPNNNEYATVLFRQKFCKLNKALARKQNLVTYMPGSAAFPCSCDARERIGSPCSFTRAGCLRAVDRITNILFGALHVPDASPLRTCTFSMIRGSTISPSSLVKHFVVVPPIAVQTHEMHIILLFPRANKIVKDVQRSTLNDAMSKTEPIYIHKITCFLLLLQVVKAENNKR